MYDFWRPKVYACGRTIILGGEDRRQSTNYVSLGYGTILTIDACGHSLKDLPQPNTPNTVEYGITCTLIA